jgi:hypothetical protein
MQSILIEDEGVVPVPGEVDQFSPFAIGEQENTPTSSDTTAETHPFRFGRIFSRSEKSPTVPIDKTPYEKLVNAMEKVVAADHPLLSAGYTYLAQFVAHDMSFLKDGKLTTRPVEPGDLEQLRSPSLDLDSLYGEGPGKDGRFYKDGIRMRIGFTEPAKIGEAEVEKVFENDLPRAGGNLSNQRAAMIADPRNDDNLLVAQTQVAFMKFHNAVADYIEEKEGPGKVSFKTVSEKVVRHYQWIVLHDLLPRIVDEKILSRVRENPSNRRFKPGDKPMMPVEFAFAAFRLGHCMVRDKYELNRVFQSPAPGQRVSVQRGAATIGSLMEMTGFRGKLQGSKRLPSNWIIDWTRFYDLSDFGVARNGQSNNAKMLGAHLAPALGSLFRFNARARNMEPVSLGVMDLVRGASLRLPTGQEAANELQDPPLSADEILKSDEPGVSDTLKENGFVESTPLWYYILKEAEVIGGGKRLGPVGSHIVAETFVGLIESSRISILDGNGWRPDLAGLPELGRKRASNAVFEMADLLVFVDKFLKRSSELNPIG